MANPYVPQSTHLFGKTRYDKPFEVLNGYLNLTLGTNATGSGFLEGTVVDISSSGTAVPAASGAMGIGFALQTVKDLSAQEGRRNLNKTEVNLGDFIGVQYGAGMCATKIHEGSGDIGDYAWWDGNRLQFASSVPSGVNAIGRLVQGDGSDPTVGVNGTSGSKYVAGSKKAILLFDFRIHDRATGA